MNENLYFDKYFEKDNIFGEKLYEVVIKLHSTTEDEKKAGKTTTYTLTPDGLRAYDEKLKESIFDVAKKFRIIYDELSFFNVEGAYGVNLFDLFKKSKEFYRFFIKSNTPKTVPDNPDNIFNIKDKDKDSLEKKIEQYKKAKDFFIYSLNDNTINTSIPFNSIESDMKEGLKKSPQFYMLMLYSFVKAFYSLNLKAFVSGKSEPEDNKLAKDVYGLQIYNYTRVEDQNKNPKLLLKKTNEKIVAAEKSNYYEADDEDYEREDLITLNNIYNLLRLGGVFKVGDIIQLSNESNAEKNNTDFIIKSNISLNPKYKKLFKIDKVKKTITVHYDITLERISDIKKLKIVLNLRGDITKNTVNYSPRLSDPKYSKYGEGIYITDNHVFRDRFLNLSKFRAITDKNEFFFDEEYFKLLMKEIDKREESADKIEDTTKKETKQKENLKQNMEYIVKRLFTKSTTIEPYNHGHLEYGGKQYMITGYAGNIDYTHYGEPEIDREKKYKTKIVDLASINIDVNDYYRIAANLDDKGEPKTANISYDKMDNIFIKENGKSQQLLPTEKIRNIDIKTGYIEHEPIEAKTGVRAKNVKTPLKNIVILGSSKNIKALHDATPKIKHVYYEGKKWEIVNLEGDTKIKIFNESDQEIVLKQGKDKTYKILVPLLLLDKGKPITFYRRFMNRDCDGAKKRIDKTLTSLFYPTRFNSITTLTFFEDLFKKSDRDKIAELVSKKNPQAQAEDKSKTSESKGGTKRLKKRSIRATRKRKKIKYTIKKRKKHNVGRYTRRLIERKHKKYKKQSK